VALIKDHFVGKISEAVQECGTASLKSGRLQVGEEGDDTVTISIPEAFGFMLEHCVAAVDVFLDIPHALYIGSAYPARYNVAHLSIYSNLTRAAFQKSKSTCEVSMIAEPSAALVNLTDPATRSGSYLAFDMGGGVTPQVQLKLYIRPYRCPNL
jgi:molecular chaperone DnaK (HSP70)